MFYSIISSTQGGWTALSSEGRYMGAAAYGDMNRSTNRFYPQLRNIFGLPARRQCVPQPGTGELAPELTSQALHPGGFIGLLGSPIAPEDMWNPDAVLRVEDIRHQPNTQERLDKAAATQMVFEEVLIHIVDRFIRTTAATGSY